MKLNKLTMTAAAAVFMSAVSSANASSLWLETTTPVVGLGDTIEMTVHMDFSDDPTLGGGFDIIFDSGLVSYDANSYITDAGLGSDPSFTRDDNPAAAAANRVEVTSDALVGAAFGNFAGMSGPALVAPITFTADAAGVAIFDLGPSSSDSVGSFFSAATFEEQFPDYQGVSVEITGISEVPVPAAVWLFGSGLLGLIGMARRRTV